MDKQVNIERFEEISNFVKDNLDEEKGVYSDSNGYSIKIVEKDKDFFLSYPDIYHYRMSDFFAIGYNRVAEIVEKEIESRERKEIEKVKHRARERWEREKKMQMEIQEEKLTNLNLAGRIKFVFFGKL